MCAIFIIRYYNLAHAVNEKVIKQPSMMRCGTLRDYQLVGCYSQDLSYLYDVSLKPDIWKEVTWVKKLF